MGSEAAGYINSKTINAANFYFPANITNITVTQEYLNNLNTTFYGSEDVLFACNSEKQNHRKIAFYILLFFFII